MNTKYLWAAVFVFIIGAGILLLVKKYFYQDSNPSGQQESAAVTVVDRASPINKRRPDFALKDLEGNIRTVQEWDGKVLIVNFWATWCPPCRKEMPAFVELQKQYGAQGVQFVGIALDDELMVKDFAETLEINYPILIGTKDTIATAKAYGDHLGALPFTALVNRKGIVVQLFPGEVEKQSLESQIKKLL